MTNPFEIAKAGGKHYGFYNQYVNKSNMEIQRAIRSLDKRIAEHESWIQNPELHLPNFSSLDSRQQRALVEDKWMRDIARQQEQKMILESILQEK